MEEQAEYITSEKRRLMELKEHIDDIRNRLEQNLFPNETAVRQGIVDRLLNALGWQTFDTQSVFPEYPIDGGRVDYALCHPPEKPLVFIEVKRVGNIEGAERQLFEYAFHEGVPILILTDGQKWRFFHPAGSGSYQERLVQELDLIADGSEESSECLFKYLTYSAVQAGIAGQLIAGGLSGNLTTKRSAQAFAGSVGELAVRHIREFRVFNRSGTI